MSETTGAAARRRYRRNRDRQRARSVIAPGPASLAELLGMIDTSARWSRADVIYLHGPVPGGSRDGFLRWVWAGLPDGWTEHADGHYLTHTARPVLKLTRPDGRRLELHRLAEWFGDGDYSPQQAAGALDLIDHALGTSFDEQACILSTPATTGRDLWLRSIPDGVEYPALTDEQQSIIRASAGQGRWEVTRGECCEACARPDDGGYAAPLYGFDARFGYAALLWGLGVGPATLDDVPEYAGQRRGRYLVAFTVPADWRHVGLLPEQHDDGWHYPNRPGYTGRAWVDGAELDVALRWGWRCDIERRLLLTDGRPLDTWQRKLVALRDQLAELYRTGEVDADTAKLAADGVRMILLTTLGAFHGARHNVSRSAPMGDEQSIPPDAVGLRPEAGRWVWTEQRGASWAALSHPEWSAAVWARCRARMVDHRRGGTGALHVPWGDVVAIRQDAIYTTNDPGWRGSRVGELRPTFASAAPVMVPRDATELLEVRRGQHSG